MTPRTLATFANKSDKDGLTRSARLLKAIGPNAAPIWAQLSPADSNALRAVMDTLPADDTANAAAAQALLNEAGQYGTPPIWQKLSALPARQLFVMLENEHPQIIALTIIRLTPKAAANLLGCMDEQATHQTLRLILQMGKPHPSAIAAIESLFEAELGFGSDPSPVQGDAALARIFDLLATETSEPLLANLAEAGTRVRKLMFTFEDIASFTPAGLQTLLSKVDRATLILALRGTKGSVAKAIFRNMTARAREVLVEEIKAMGPVRRADVEAAKTDLVVLARHLVETGEILQSDPDDDLLEDTDMIA